MQIHVLFSYKDIYVFVSFWSGGATGFNPHLPNFLLVRIFHVGQLQAGG